MEIRRCKVCFRNFANGRALGGHMRSHKNINASKFIEQMDELIDHSCSSSDDPEFSVVLQDGESESESSRNNNPFAVGRRSKRSRRKTRVISNLTPSKMVMRRFGETDDHQQSPSRSSSVSDTTTTEEDVAHCLMMLSRDKWERENEEEEEEDDDDEYSEHVKVKVKVMMIKSSNAKFVRGKYRCETCNKLFKSYQALGGHRASYKKIKTVAAAPPPGGGAVAAEEKVHECPFCHRVFASGQALGGHKRSHFMGSASNVTTTVSKIVENLEIDLNLPAPIDDDDDQ